MNRYLYVKYLKESSTKGFLQIVQQSHRCHEFHDGTNNFQYTDAVGRCHRLNSANSPDYMGNCMYVRGTSISRDFAIITINCYLPQTLNNILLYNQQFNKNKLVLEDVAECIHSSEQFDEMPVGYTAHVPDDDDAEYDDDDDVYDVDDYDDE